MPPITPPTPLPYHPPPPPAFPVDPLCCTISPKNVYFKAFLEPAWAHMGQGWLKIPFNHLFEDPKRSRNNFEKKIMFYHFWTQC